MFGISTKKTPPIETLVRAAFANDTFLKESKDRNQEEFVISLLSLFTAFQSISDFTADRKLKKYVKRTNADIVALELSLFTICQSIYDIEHEGFDGDESVDDFYEYLDEEFDPHANPYYEDLKRSVHCTRAFFERDYNDCEKYINKRIFQYSNDPKSSSEVLSLNLTSVFGANDFVDLDDQVRLDLNLQLRMMAFAVSYRKAMVPAFIESVENYVNIT